MSTVPRGAALAREDEFEGAKTPERDPASSTQDDLESPAPAAPLEFSAPQATPPPPLGADAAEFASGPRVQAAAPARDALANVLHGIDLAGSHLAGARNAYEQLFLHLGRLRQEWVEQAAAQERFKELELERNRLRVELEDAKQAAAAERAFLVEEQDRFLGGVLEEHEQALLRLTAEREAARAQLSQARTIPSEPLDDDSDLTAPGMSLSHLQRKLSEATVRIGKLVDESERAREVLRRLQLQRDDAHAHVARLTAERNKAQSELFALQAERVSNHRTIPQAHPPSTYPPPVPTLQGHSPSKGEFAEAVSSSEASAEPVIETQYPDQRTRPLKQKPSPTETPLGAYSMASDDLTLDHLDIGQDKRDR